MLNVKLDVIKHLQPDEHDKDTVHALTSPVPTILHIHVEREKIKPLKAAEITMGGAARGEVISFSRQPFMGKTQSCLSVPMGVQSLVFCDLILKEKTVFSIREITLHTHYF